MDTVISFLYCRIIQNNQDNLAGFVANFVGKDLNYYNQPNRGNDSK
jgi:hypothetical protein